MSNRTPRAGVSPFAHLLSLATGGRAGARADDNDQRTDEDEEARKARRAEEDQKREEEDARRAEEDQRREEEDARRAEEDGDPEDPEDPKDPEEEKSKKGKRAKKAKRAEDDDQDPEADSDDDDDEAEECDDEKEAKAYRRGLAVGRGRENARASRIFSNAAAAGRPDLAATLAFTTRNSSAEAGRLMSAASVQPKARGRLDDRMAGRSDARPGADSRPGAPSTAEQIIIAGKKRRGEI